MHPKYTIAPGASTPIQRVLDRLRSGGYDPRPAGDGQWKSRCPGHKGDGHNLSVKEGTDGAVLLHCHRVDETGRNCSAADIVAELRLELKDLFAPVPGAYHGNGNGNGKHSGNGKPKGKGYPTAEAAIAALKLGKPKGVWTYHEAGGAPVASVARFDLAKGKTFRPIHLESSGWFIGDPPGLWPLYALPEFDDPGPIYFVEGEKCAELVLDLGLVATTTAHGAKSPHKTDLSPLAGREVVILPDVGPAGEGYASRLVGLLGEVEPRPTVKVVQLPGLAEDGDDIEQWLELRDAQGPPELVAELRRLADAAPVVDWDRSDAPEKEKDKEKEAAPRFSLELVDSATFFGQEYRLDWLVKGVVVRGDAAAMGGPTKSLKTSILIDLAVSLASATPFLGRFDVPQSRRVALISGESGRRAIQSSARQVCLSRDLTSRDIANVFWGFTLPQLTNAEHLAVIRKTIEDNGLECIVIDPFYLTVLAGNAGVDVKSMFEMGPLLNDVARTCIEAGCTPIIAHHFTKKREDPFGPPELTDFAYGGFTNFIRQWMMVSPRERFDAEIGLFKLHFYFGGSAGHCGEHAVDIEVGKLDPDMDRRCWKVTIASPSEERAARQEQRKAEAERKAEEKRKAADAEKDREECELIAVAVAALKGEPERKATARRLRLILGCRADKADRIIVRMEKSGLVRPVDDVRVSTGKGRFKDSPGYQLSDDPDRVL